MLKIDKNVSISGASQDHLFNWINDIRNWEQLMPHERIENWSANENSCHFSLKGLASLSLSKTDSEAYTVKVVNPDAKPFEISIQISVEADADNCNTVHLTFEGNMNSFMKMMAEKPLSNFIEGLGQNLKKVIEES